MKQIFHFKQKYRSVNSYRNTISEWAVIFRYENFFIPRVEKSSKISPWEKNLASRGPTALGRTRFFALGLIFEDFSTLGMKKFPYLKNGPFGNPIFQFQEEGLIQAQFNLLSENAQILKFHIPYNINGHSFELQLLLYYTAGGRMAAEKPFEAKIESWCYFSRA